MRKILPLLFLVALTFCFSAWEVSADSQTTRPIPKVSDAAACSIDDFGHNDGCESDKGGGGGGNYTIPVVHINTGNVAGLSLAAGRSASNSQSSKVALNSLNLRNHSSSAPSLNHLASIRNIFGNAAFLPQLASGVIFSPIAPLPHSATTLACPTTSGVVLISLPGDQVTASRYSYGLQDSDPNDDALNYEHSVSNALSATGCTAITLVGAGYFKRFGSLTDSARNAYAYDLNNNRTRWLHSDVGCTGLSQHVGDSTLPTSCPNTSADACGGGLCSFSTGYGSEALDISDEGLAVSGVTFDFQWPSPESMSTGYLWFEPFNVLSRNANGEFNITSGGAIQTVRSTSETSVSDSLVLRDFRENYSEPIDLGGGSLADARAVTYLGNGIFSVGGSGRIDDDSGAIWNYQNDNNTLLPPAPSYSETGGTRGLSVSKIREGADGIQSFGTRISSDVAAMHIVTIGTQTTEQTFPSSITNPAMPMTFTTDVAADWAVVGYRAGSCWLNTSSPCVVAGQETSYNLGLPNPAVPVLWDRVRNTAVDIPRPFRTGSTSQEAVSAVALGAVEYGTNRIVVVGDYANQPGGSQTTSAFVSVCTRNPTNNNICCSRAQELGSYLASKNVPRPSNIAHYATAHDVKVVGNHLLITGSAITTGEIGTLKPYLARVILSQPTSCQITCN